MFPDMLLLSSQSQLGKKRSELKLIIKEREKKLEEIKHSTKVLKVSPVCTSLLNIWIGVLITQLSFDLHFMNY